MRQRINISAHWKCWETRRYFTCLLISHYIFVAWYKHLIWLVTTRKMAVTFSKNPVGISSLYFQIFWCTVTVCWASSNANESSFYSLPAFKLTELLRLKSNIQWVERKCDSSDGKHKVDLYVKMANVPPLCLIHLTVSDCNQPRAAHCWCFVIMDAAYIFSGLSTSSVKYKIITSTSGAPPLSVARSTWTHTGN